MKSVYKASYAIDLANINYFTSFHTKRSVETHGFHPAEKIFVSISFWTCRTSTRIQCTSDVFISAYFLARLLKLTQFGIHGTWMLFFIREIFWQSLFKSLSLFSCRWTSIIFACIMANLSEWNGTRTHNHLVCKRTLNNLAKLAKWLSCVVSTHQYVFCHIPYFWNWAFWKVYLPHRHSV